MFHIRKSEIPVVFLVLPFIVGSIVGLYCQSWFSIPLLITTLCICAGIFISLNLAYNFFKLYRCSWLGGVLVHVILFTAGLLSMASSQQISQPDHFSKIKSNYLVVKVSSEPKRSAQYFRFVAEVKESLFRKKFQPTIGKLLVTVVADSNSHPVAYGDELLIPANYKAVEAPYSPAEFNYKQYLAHQNVYHQSFITTRQFVKTATQQGNVLITIALRVRRQMVQVLKNHLHTPETIAVASTLILGYKADLSADVVQAYAKTGTIHVLSVSGAHVAVIFWFISFILTPLSRNRYGKWLSSFLSIALIWSYALLTGFSPAVCRAAIMISLLVIGKTTSRHVHALNMLAISALALLLYDPLLITDVGFQLSYLAVAGLIVLQPVIDKQFDFKKQWMKKLWYFCSASIAAQLITFPLSAFYFHQFPAYFLISNLFIIIPSELIMVTGMLLLLFAEVPLLNTWLAYVLEYGILFMNKTLMVIERLPFASISKIWLSSFEYIVLYIIIGLACLYMLYRRGWQLVTGALALLILSVSVSFKTYSRERSDRLIFLNLKKHSGIVLTHGHEAVVITDLKDTDKNYQYSIQPCLDSLQATAVQTISLRQNINNRFVKKQLNLVQYNNKTILMLDKHLQNVKLARKVQVDYLFVTGSPKVSLAFLTKNYTFDLLILDANNSKQRIEALMNEAHKMNIKLFCLRRNKALTIVSN